MVESVGKYQRYEEYKDSGVEWLGEIPSHWVMNKLRYLFAFSKGLTITKENLVDEGIPCVNYGEVHSKYGFQVDPLKHILKCVEEKYLKSSPNSLLNKGDFIFADTSEDLKGSGNFTHLVNSEKVFAGYHTVIGRPQDATVSRFYAYLFDSAEFRSQIQLAVKGVKVFSITQAMLRASNIWLPSKDEKKKIANFLDHETAKIDSLIEKQQQLIQLLKEKRQAVIRHAVTKGLDSSVKMKDSGVEWLGEVPEHWDTAPLKHLCELLKDGTHLPPPRVDSGIPLLSVRNIINNKFTFRDDDSQISESSYADLCKSFIPKNGDVVLAIVGATIGKVALIEKMENFHIQRSLGIFRTRKTKLNNYFLAYIFGSKGFQSLLWENAGFSAQPGIYLGALSNFLIPVPSIEEQKSIIDFIEIQLVNFDNLINKALHSVQLMQERRTVLISAAVTGKIDVRQWQNPNKNNEAKMEFSA